MVFGLKTPVKRGYDIPIVSIFSTIDTNVDNVNVKLDNAMRDAIALLYNHGHRKIAFLSEPYTAGKAELFLDACHRYRDLEISVYESPYRFEKAGHDGIKSHFLPKREATALVCAYDYIAIGAMKELKKAGISVPEQVSVIGADNIGSAEYAQVPLTTIDSASDEVCSIAWELLCKKQQNKYWRANRDITIKATLVVRDSVADAWEEGFVGKTS